MELDPAIRDEVWNEDGRRVEERIELCVGSIDSLCGPLSIDLCGPACRSGIGRDLYLRDLSGPADARSASILPVYGLDY